MKLLTDEGCSEEPDSGVGRGALGVERLQHVVREGQRCDGIP